MDGGTKFKVEVRKVRKGQKKEDVKFLTFNFIFNCILCIEVIRNDCYVCIMWYMCA